MALLWTRMDLLIPPLFFFLPRFCWLSRAAHVLCRPRVVNVHAPTPPTLPFNFFFLKTPSLTRPIYVTAVLLLTAFALSPLVSAAPVSEISRFSLTLLRKKGRKKKKTVCSKDFNLPANLYGSLPAEDTEPIQGGGILPPHVKKAVWVFWKFFALSLSLPPSFSIFFPFFALGKERKIKKKKKSTYLDAPAVTCRLVKSGAKRCVSLCLFNDDARYFATFAIFFSPLRASYIVSQLFGKSFLRGMCENPLLPPLSPSSLTLFSWLAEQHVSVIMRSKQLQQQQLHWQRCLSSAT